MQGIIIPAVLTAYIVFVVDVYRTRLVEHSKFEARKGQSTHADRGGD
jgi:hypothetical protein